MAVAGFKIAVNHCIRPFHTVPIAIYTDIPIAFIKCIPEERAPHSISGTLGNTENVLDYIDQWVRDYLKHINAENKSFRFEIKLFSHSHLDSSLILILIISATCTILNEWLHHPIEKNELLSWLMEKNEYRDADIISTCMYGGIMSVVGIRPFRVYQPKGLFFHLENISESEAKPLPSSIIPLILLAIERSDFNSMHDLLNNIHAVGNIEDSYLGILDLPNSKLRLHIHNVSTPNFSSIVKHGELSPIFGIDSNGCSVV